MRLFRSASVALLVVGAACARGRPSTATQPALACERGDSAMVRGELFMGRNIPGGGEVSDAEWKEFMESFVTPRFPEGLSILEGNGQWRGASGVIERERGKVLMVLYGTDDDAAQRRLDEIAAEYKRRFRQESVLRVRSRVCTHF